LLFQTVLLPSIGGHVQNIGMGVVRWATGTTSNGKKRKLTAKANGPPCFPNTLPFMETAFMNTSHETQFLSEIADPDAAIPESKLAYFEQRVLNGFYDYVLTQFEKECQEHGLTKARLARRVNRGADQINRLLASPGNWTIRTVARLLVGICAREARLESDNILGRKPQNMTTMDLLNREIDRTDYQGEAGKIILREDQSSTGKGTMTEGTVIEHLTLN
jgi:hypothetical protein